MYEIKWLPKAEKEYFGILDFWIAHNQSSSYSLKIIDEVKNAENLLQLSPKIGAKIKILKI